jgi:hypothetical protein
MNLSKLKRVFKIKSLSSGNTPKVIFLHIPKTAGTSFARIIENNYSKSEFYLATAGNVESRQYIMNSLNSFLKLPKREQDKIKIIKGHFPYGLHEKMNWSDYKYVSFIRNPVERLFSEYYYIKDNPTHPLSQLCNEISFEEYALSDDYHLQNQQIRMLAGFDALFETDMHRVYELAIKNVSSENFILGLTERFSDSLSMIGKALGWKNVEEQFVRYPSKKPSKMAIDREVLSEIEMKNYWDIKFYEHISKLFEN